MSAQGNAQPIIIKRKKVVAGDGHHGGAWKVAYADFVTAMMAFFLLMWLLNATTEKQRKGLADYFSPTISINRVSGGGDGNFGGESVFSEDVLPKNGVGASDSFATEAEQVRGEMGMLYDNANGNSVEQSEQDDKFELIQDTLFGSGGESFVSKDVYRHVVTRVTDEGLVIELFDLPDATLFEPGTDQPTLILEDLAQLLVEVSGIFENNFAIEGHTKALPIVVAKNPVWNLSTDRADRMRTLLEGKGLAANRVKRITGHADRDLAVRNPMATRNNRLEVIVLRSE